MARWLSHQDDFKNQVSMLEELVKRRGHEIIFLPKFHCELNPIEMYWGWVKYRFREEDKPKFEDAKQAAIKYLDACTAEIIRHFINRTWRWMDAYRSGLTGAAAAWAARRQSAHRYASKHAAEALDASAASAGSSAATRNCLPWSPEAIDPAIFSHVIYAYASLTAAGVVSLTASQQAQVKTIVALKAGTPNLKVLIAVGGWGLGVDASPLIAIATSSSARTKFGTSALALLTSLGADGIDLEWTPCIGTTCISAIQFSTIATAVKAGIGSNLLSLSTPNAFWSLSGVNTITTSLAKIVEFVSLITHQPSTSSDDANEFDVIQVTLKKAQSAGMPPTLLLFGVPFYSRPVGTSSLQSSCMASGDLAQGTYPYFAVDAIINDGLYDSDDYTDLTLDETTSVQWLTMSDGSTMASESPLSVSARALLSQNLCMGGISVFSLDQDNTLSELTSAIYAPGGLLPTHDSIVASMSIESLDSAGYLRDGVYDGFATTLANEYAFLNVPDSFRILLLGALQIQTQLSNRLRLFLTESDLANDSFNLYKTWEGKAADYNLANITGTGHNYWHCEGDTSPHLTQYDTVQWFLDDADGFKQYLNESVGINLDDLVDGEFYVTRLGSSCTTGGGTGKTPRAGPTETVPRSPVPTLHDAHSISRRRSRHHSHQTKKRDTDDPSDPYDPPESCRTKWTGLRLINPDTFFANPIDVIQSFVQSTDNAVTKFTRLAAAPDADTGSLIGLLTTTLTAISLGNQTIANTIAYIHEVEYDKVRQAAFDQAHARESVLKIIANIGLMILSIVPGVGEISDIVVGGLDTFGLISKAMDAFSLAKTLDKDSDILKLFGTGLRTEDEIAGAAEAAEDAISVEARETRGNLASSAGKVQDTAIQCLKSTFGPWAMDTSKLGSVLTRRSFQSPESTISGNFLENRAKAADPCVFRLYTGEELKISSKKYRALCAEVNLPMDVPDDLANPTKTSSRPFNECVTLFKGDCQCDHLFEPDEWLSRTAVVSHDDSAVLCQALTGVNTREEIMAIINDKTNLAGLWGSRTNGYNPNVLKNKLMNGYSEAALKDVYQKYNEGGMKIVYDVANDHITTYSKARKTTAGLLDARLHAYHEIVLNSGSAEALAIMEEQIYKPNDDASVKSTMVTIAKKSEDRAAAVIAHLRDEDPVSNEENPDDTAEEAAESEDDGRVRSKRPLSPGTTSTCSNDAEAARKKVKI
ncbi:hypothetical protein C8R44DRAFT_879603 [Mycena epipterygia]|nr:hypothetical protein C8R44DRAFT_879603 [Mycena epipterygia]